MKKLLLSIPLIIIFIHIFVNVDAGPMVWTTDFVNFGRILAVNVNPTTQATVYAGSIDNGFIKSTNSGLTWAASNTGLTYNNVQCMSVCRSNSNIIYIGTDSLSGSASTKGVYKSTDGGNSWSNVTNDGFTSDRSVQTIAVDPTNPNNVYAGIFNALHDCADGLWKSSNGGANWIIANNGMGTDKNILWVTIDPNNSSVVYAGTSFTVTSQTGPAFIYKSTNAGVSWTNSSTGLPSTSADINPVRGISVSDANSQYVCAGLFQNTTSGGFFLSTNAGASWTKMSNGIPSVAATNIRAVLFRPGSTTEMYCAIDAGGTNPGGVYRSVDGASSWTAFNGGTLLSTYLTRALTFRTVPDSTLYTGVGSTAVSTTPGQGAYEYSLFTPVGIHNQNTGLPKDFSLNQNYPNPFNPSTIIEFAVPKTALVTVKVYDMSGREVKTLVNESKNAGYYQVTFNANNLASGVYFYKIQAGDFRATKKMILVK